MAPNRNEKLGFGKLFWLLAAVCGLSVAAHLAFYPALPDIVPSHWGMNGEVNGWAPKWAALLLDLLPLALLLGMQFLPNIDPRQDSYRKSGKVWPIFQVSFTLFMTAVTWMTELSAFGLLGGGSISLFVCWGIGALFLALGNYMPQVRQNYTFGVKTPWALADAHNWQRSQRMGGIVFTAAGAYTLVAPLFSLPAAFIGMLVLILGGTAWLYLYSYLVYAGKLK